MILLLSQGGQARRMGVPRRLVKPVSVDVSDRG